MDGLLALGALLALAFPATVVALVFLVVGLRRRVRRLEDDVQRLAHGISEGIAEGASVSRAEEVAGPDAVLLERVDPAVAGPAVAAADEAASPDPVTAAEQAGRDDPWAGRSHAAGGDDRKAEGAIVFTGARVSALGTWLQQNWVYSISALSLAFAGIFFVQYGVEKGILTPQMRVLMAIVFGLALIGAGEVVRRRSGDGARVATAYLPSTFSGAGLVSMFAGVLAARQLYGLIGVEAAFGGVVGVAMIAILLGWFYGPFLAAFGLIGAAAAPFVVGGGTQEADWLYAYFGMVALAGLAVDAVRRWAWVSVLALALGYIGGWLVLLGMGSGIGWFMILLTVLAVSAVLVPCLRLQPDHDGPMLAEAVWSRGAAGWPGFPTRIAAGAIALSVLGLTALAGGNAAEGALAFMGLALLAVVLIHWSANARALSDLAVLPVAGLIARLAAEGASNWPLAADYRLAAIGVRAAETAPPMTAAVLLGLGLAVTLLAAWRSGGTEYRAHWAALAALAAPLAAVALELFWEPALVLGSGPWAFHVIAVACVMTLLAVRFARSDGADLRRAAYSILACLSLIALALFLVLTKGALTLALATLVAVAAWLDRRFRLPEMGLFIQAAIAGLGWRLIVDPGLVWAVDEAALWEVLAAYGGAAAAMVAGIRLLAGLDRRTALVLLESGGATFAALLANVLITRGLTAGQDESWIVAHWALTLNALPWLVLMLSQLYRLQLGGALRAVRWAIACVAGLIALGGIASAVFPASPLLGQGYGSERMVLGPPVLDTLLVAYGVPALVIGLALVRLGHLPRVLRRALQGVAVGLASLNAGLEIRRVWRGPDLSVPGVTQAELYSYTIALMVVGAGLLYQAIARGSAPLRRAAMGVIAVTVAKVFLIDAAGLSGLTRVFSFLALGLSLAGLAWLNRWAAAQQEGTGADQA